MLDLLYNNSLC